MIKRSKIRLFLILSSTFVFLGCPYKPPFIKNKINFEKVTITQKDSCVAIIKFTVKYYSDSLNQNYFASSIEKGQDGSDYKIRFIGLDGNTCKKGSCNYDDLDDISLKINSKKNLFNGEFITLDKYICIHNASGIKMVLENKKNNRKDTLSVVYIPISASNLNMQESKKIN